MTERENIPANAFFASNGRDTLHGASESGWDSGLHSDLDSLERTETYIGNEFCRGGRRQVENGLVLGGSLLSSQLAVQVLEVFVEAILAGTLDGVSHERWAPTSKDTANALCFADLSPGFEVTFVEVGIDLASTFDQVKRCDGSVSGSLLAVTFSYRSPPQESKCQTYTS